MTVLDDARRPPVLAPNWTPEQATESNGAVWPTLGQAVWALRHGSDFAHVLRLVRRLTELRRLAATLDGSPEPPYAGSPS